MRARSSAASASSRRSGATTSTRARTSSTSASAVCGRSSAPARSRPFAMRGIGLLRRRGLEIAWVAFAAANLVAMGRWQSWETIPFHFIWVSLTLLYGFRTWRPLPTLAALGGVVLSTAIVIRVAVGGGAQQRRRRFDVRLLATMYRATAWHA